MSEDATNPWNLLRRASAHFDERVRQLEVRLGEPSAGEWLAKLAALPALESPLPGTLDAFVARLFQGGQDSEVQQSQLANDDEALCEQQAWATLAELAPEPFASMAQTVLERSHSLSETSADGLDAPQERHRFGSYEVVDSVNPLGQGSAGLVYEARNIDNGRPAALKLLHVESLRQAQRFRSEARIVAALKHPAIVEVLDSGVVVHDGKPQAFIVYGLVDGGVRFDKAMHGKPLRALLGAAACVADALAHAHARGVLHRDITPNNVLVDALGNPHIVDFGIAAVLSDEEASEATGAALGTLGFMSPQQANGDRPRESDDVWGLGALMFQALAGDTPHALKQSSGEPLGAEAAREVMRTQQARLLGEVRQDLRGTDLEAVLAKALSSDPQGRYSSMSDLKSDIERALRGEPVAAKAHSFARRTRHWVRTHLVASVATGAVLLGLSVGGVLAVMEWRRAVSAEHASAQAATDAQSALSMSVSFAHLLAETAVPTEQQMRLLDSAIAVVERSRLSSDPDRARSGMRLEARLRGILGDLALRAKEMTRAAQERSRVLALERELSASAHGNPRLLAQALVHLGDLEKEKNPEGARTLYLEAHELLRKLADAESSNSDAWDDLGWSYERLADLALRRFNQHAEALRLSEERTRIASTLLEQSPSPLRHYGVASALAMRAACELAASNDNKATQLAVLRYREDVCRHITEAVTADPSRRSFLLAAVSFHLHLFQSVRDVHGLQNAATPLAKACAFADASVARNTRDQDARDIAVVVYEEAAYAAYRQGDHAGAERAFQTTYGHAEAARVLADVPKVRTKARQIAVAGFENANQQGDAGAAKEWARRVNYEFDVAMRASPTPAELAAFALWLLEVAPPAERDPGRAGTLAQQAARALTESSDAPERSEVARVLDALGLKEQADAVRLGDRPK